MKKLILLLPLLLIFSCGKKDSSDSGNKDSKEKTTSTDDKKNEKPQNGSDTKPKSTLRGSYTGGFDAVKYTRDDIVYSNRITVFVDSVQGENIFGRSIVAGNDRPFKGSCTGSAGAYKVEAAEPGDNKYDGKFSFTIMPDSGIITGKWVANDSKLDVTERQYRLEKKEFKYN